MALDLTAASGGETLEARAPAHFVRGTQWKLCLCSTVDFAVRASAGAVAAVVDQGWETSRG